MTIGITEDHIGNSGISNSGKRHSKRNRKRRRRLSYIQHGAPLDALGNPPLNYLISRNSNGSYFGTGPNQASSSFIGLRGKQEIGDNLYAVFNPQTIFDPVSGNNANGIGDGAAQNRGMTI